MLGLCFRPSTLKRTFRNDVPLSSEVRQCQADGCIANLRDATKYHRRYRVCRAHSKAPCVSSGGLIQRFCQRCTKFHCLYEFDQGKRSCRRGLAERNQRRRKPQLAASSGEGPSAKSGADLNTSTDPTSTPAQPKKRKSRSANSVSQEESANKSGSAGNNWQFPKLGGLEHPPHLALSSQARTVLGTNGLLSSSSVAVPVPLSLQAASVSGPDDYGFLLFQSIAPSVPLSSQATSESGPDAYDFLPFQSIAPPVPLSSQATSESGPDAYDFLPFQSIAPPVPLSSQATSESAPDAYDFLPFQSIAPPVPLSSQATSESAPDAYDFLPFLSIAPPVPLSSQATSESGPHAYDFLPFLSIAPPVPLRSQATLECGPDGYDCLRFHSIAPPVPLGHPKVHHHLSTLLGNSQETAFSQQFLQDLGGREGSTSSYFCLDQGLGLGYQAQRSSSVVMQHYNRMEPPTCSDTKTTVSGPTLNLPPVPEKSGPGSDQQITYTGSTSAGQGYSFLTQNPVSRWLCDLNGLSCHAALTGSFGGQQCGLLEDMFRTSHR